MITEILLSISVIINIVMVFYVKWVLNNYKEVVLGLENIGNLIAEYVIHLKSVYELEMFYGDATLNHLMNHAISFNEQLETFEYIYSLTDQPQLTTEDEEEIDDEEENETEA